MLKEERKADVAEDKAALVASNQKLAGRLRRAIGESTGSQTVVGKNLGVDTSKDEGENHDQKTQAGQSSQSGSEDECAETSTPDEVEETCQDKHRPEECLRSACRRVGQD